MEKRMNSLSIGVSLIKKMIAVIKTDVNLYLLTWKDADLVKNAVRNIYHKVSTIFEQACVHAHPVKVALLNYFMYY